MCNTAVDEDEKSDRSFPVQNEQERYEMAQDPKFGCMARSSTWFCYHNNDERAEDVTWHIKYSILKTAGKLGVGGLEEGV